MSRETIRLGDNGGRQLTCTLGLAGVTPIPVDAALEETRTSLSRCANSGGGGGGGDKTLN